MRTGLAYFQMPTNTVGVSGSRYTFESISQDPTYECVLRHFKREVVVAPGRRGLFLSGTYRDGAIKFLPPAIEAAETMLTPEQTAQLCDDAFTHIGIAAFQAFERYPEIFRVARGYLEPSHIYEILDRLTKEAQNTLPFHGIARAIESMQGLSSKSIVELIGSGIYTSTTQNSCSVVGGCGGGRDYDAGARAFRILDRLGPAFLVSRLRFSSDEEAVAFFKLTKKRFGKSADKVIRAMPGLLSGINDEYSNEQIVDAITRPNIPGLSPTANAIVALYKIVLFKQGDPDPDLKVEQRIKRLRIEGGRARRSDLPTIGGKVSGNRADFNEMFFDYLDMLGFTCREDILFRHWGEVSRTKRAMIVLPAARSEYEARCLIDVLRDIGVFRDGAILRHQITVAGRLIDEAKYIELALHSAQPIPIPYPDLLMSPIKGFDHLAPVVSGGWELTDINKKGPWFNWRFDLALMNIYVLKEVRQVLRQAMGRSDDDQSLMEQLLLGMYELYEAEWKAEYEDDVPENTSDERDLVRVERGVGNVEFFIPQSVNPDIAEEYIEALEIPYGKKLKHLRQHHKFTLRATQLLSWAMHSPFFSERRKVFRDFMSRMHDLYRGAGIESTLTTRWKRRRWEQIYPSLSQLDAIKDPEFHNAVRTLVVKTVKKLQRMV